SCTIALEYDQTGNGNNAQNSTGATQPAVAIEGSNLNNVVCGTWGNGGNVSLNVVANSATNGLFANGGFASVVSYKTATITNSMRLISKLAGGVGWELSGAYSLGYGYPQFTVDGSGSNGAWVSGSFMPSFGGHIFDVAYNYSSLANAPNVAIDGGALAYQSAT